MPPIPEAPTREDAIEAMAFVRGELLGDFPFATDADRASALGLLLTPLVRMSVTLAPLCIIDAPIRGAGKGLLADLVAIIATGKPAEIYGLPVREEELAKAITAMLFEGASLVFIDEVQELRSPKLQQALTSETYRDRPFGRNTEMKSVPQRATWMVAGKNIAVHGDSDRRSFRTRLDPKMTRPWTRSGFRHPKLRHWARAHRGQLLAALLTAARAWLVAERPLASVPVFGSFEEWAETVGGILAYARVDGFLANLTEHWDEANEEANEWEEFLAALRLHFAGRGPWKAGDAARAVQGNNELKAVLPTELVEKESTLGFSKSLGAALKGRVDIVHGERGLRVIRQKDDHSKQYRFRVVADQDP